MTGKKKDKRDAPVSLNPLDPKEALADLMKVKPEREKEAPGKSRSGRDRQDS
jgi:hypothetical protein